LASGRRGRASRGGIGEELPRVLRDLLKAISITLLRTLGALAAVDILTVLAVVVVCLILVVHLDIRVKIVSILAVLSA
jgi:hypothetical protein